MTEKNYTLYLNVEVVERLQQQGVNLSELVRNLLAKYSAPPISMSDIEYDIMRKEAELSAIRQMKEQKAKEIDKTAEVRKTLISNPKFIEVAKRVKQNPVSVEANCRVLKNTMGITITPEELLAIISTMDGLE